MAEMKDLGKDLKWIVLSDNISVQHLYALQVCTCVNLPHKWIIQQIRAHHYYDTHNNERRFILILYLKLNSKP